MTLKISKITKTFFVAVCLFALVLMGFGMVTRAAETGAVTATVTVQNISVTVTDGAVAYGTLGQNATADTEPADGQTATNNGNVTEDFNIMGSDSGDWTLGATAASDVYIHRFCNDTTSDCTTPPTNYTALTTSYQTLSTGVAATSGTTLFQLQINTPNPSTVYTEQSVNVTVQAVAG